ncbi:MAG TPA: endolytic transglycosylase MltG [Bacteroidota bacterium]|nr:endolytic transglycosylase MltG [Bacteroidota bacterium]
MREFLSKHRKAAAAAAAFCLALLAASAWIAWGPNAFPGGTERTLFVSRGETFSSVVDSLEAKGIIRSRFEFMVVVRVMGGAEKMQVGKYVFASGIANADLFQRLRTGKGSQLISVTVPEGFRVRGEARLFARALGVDSARYARLAFDPAFARSLGIDAESLEGYLLPETYEFSWDADEREILRREVQSFRGFFTDTLRTRCATFGWSVHQAVTFASIVEGEAVLPDEREIISGVYHNRLGRGMKLEADPTIQYVLDDGPRRLTYEDLRTASPYNTYRFAGLPPGPINNPGKASLVAALYPQGNGYLFFVANGRGGHWFSKTYDEHLHYVRLYKRQRRLREHNSHAREGEK